MLSSIRGTRYLASTNRSFSRYIKPNNNIFGKQSFVRLKHTSLLTDICSLRDTIRKETKELDATWKDGDERDGWPTYSNKHAFFSAGSIGELQHKHDEQLATMQKQLHPKYQAVIIPNRGEVAHTLIQELDQLGIKSYILYTPQDENSPAARDCDQSIPIRDYMNMEEILQVIDRIAHIEKGHRNIAVHPGIGFWAEVPEFAREIENRNLTWVGPSSQVLSAIGSKAQAKNIAMEVYEAFSAEEKEWFGAPPLLPDFHGGDQSINKLKEEAEKIGYPVLLKAVMGGGGRGIVRLDNPEMLEETVETTKALSARLFASPEVLIEKYIPVNGHKEVQVVCDGEEVNILGMRACDLQHKYQKMVEEAPAPLTTGQRERMEFFAKRLGEKMVPLGLKAAVTVEFFLDVDTGRYYFGEVNPRLQIEHHVTQQVTGIHIPRLQFEVCQGRKLKDLLPNGVQEKGFAIEGRVYAYDTSNLMPTGHFMPSSGTVGDLYPGPEDTVNGLSAVWGVEKGTNINIDVDPMIGKLLQWGENRDDAIKRFKENLDTVVKVDGIKTNIPLLSTIMEHPLYLGQPNTHCLPVIVQDHLKKQE